MKNIQCFFNVKPINKNCKTERCTEKICVRFQFLFLFLKHNKRVTGKKGINVWYIYSYLSLLSSLIFYKVLRETPCTTLVPTIPQLASSCRAHLFKELQNQTS